MEHYKENQTDFAVPQNRDTEDIKKQGASAKKIGARYHANRFYYSPSAWNYVNGLWDYKDYNYNYSNRKEFKLPKNAESALKGEGKRGGLGDFDTTFAPDSIPNLHIDQLNKYFVAAKKRCGKLVPKRFVYDVIRDTPVCIVTAKDVDKTLVINNVEVTVPTSQEKESILIELGVYIPQQIGYPERCIFIWIDRVHECADNMMKEYGSWNNEFAVKLLFQNVLIHEFFHAIFDIQQEDNKYISSGNINNYQGSIGNISINEETIDNSYVLMLYRMFASNASFEFIFNFIKNQPKFYNEATQFYTRYSEIEIKLMELLNSK